MSDIRSVRNNNPGNIRAGAPWQGLMPRTLMSPAQAAETAFCVFLTPVWGFRAMATIFHVYAAKDGVKTLRQAIARWAPPGENNTDAYVKAVCAFAAGSGPSLDPDAPYDFHDQGALGRLLQAVAIHEAGGWYFQAADLSAGVAAAH